jgi:hypothetical protein
LAQPQAPAGGDGHDGVVLLRPRCAWRMAVE